MKNYTTFLFLSIILCISIMAVDFYVLGVVGSGTDALLIDEHSVCHYVTNASATNAYFVPTKTAPEWASFVSNANSITDITVLPCCAKVC